MPATILPETQKDYQRIGVLLVLCSAAVYGIASLAGLKAETFFGIFLINYAVSLLYGCLIIFSRKRRSGPKGLHCFLLCLVLALISAYALNHFIPVFESSVPWLSCCLVVVAAAYTSLGYMDRFRAWQRILAGFVTGTGLLLFLYLSIFLLPLAPFALVGSVFLGISLHALVPLFFVIFTIKWMVEVGREYRYVAASFFAGLLFSFLVILLFCLQWNRIDRLVHHCYQRSFVADNTDLPAWMKVAQRLSGNWLTEEYLKAGFVYTVAKQDDNWLDWSLPRVDFEETRKHDPLIVIATFFNNRQALNEEERLKVLESAFGARHKTLERLWRGDDLQTTDVVTHVRLWPELRMAYTEKTLTVGRRHGGTDNRWSGQEAIYTFHLPEGGVVTALSLWIDGREAPGILTTKGKAAQAYRQIVGVESRDPSVVHWQEGNTVSVRVFPVPADGSRMFKIGITAPLATVKDRLFYDNIYFEGPDAATAREVVRLDWVGKTAPEQPEGFEPGAPGRFMREGNYQQHWQLDVAAPPVSNGSFAFNGKTYTVAAFEPQRDAAFFDKIYLDLNGSWTRREFDAAWHTFSGKAVYVYDDGLVQLSDKNREKIFRRMQDYHFSLFPLQEIDEPATALLVTKGGSEGPAIGDLKDTEFGQRLDAWLQQGQKLRLFNLGRTLNPYLSTLKEHRAFVYEQGDTELLQQLVTGSSFATDAERADKIVLERAGIQVTSGAGTTDTHAPDHVMRLFTYNHLMQQLRSGLYTNHEVDTALVAEAQEAGIVSPLSSLVVLETAADYNRFDISQSKNSLQNASMKSKGAVPEPEEWALIAIAAALVVFLYRKKQLKVLWKSS
ncbi:XrtN system VIT domain-containing protein [Taibaiella chishuiensis]|uniref:XrtN system VIT domain protein n=1 Tax=Taibaiella chishuiensis TaxID=1434707 RepID=A0A2P8D4N5_9BACT|nr:XrtN system VIT domain-containing protein [Taibaiella chishuiensis]PSK92172.1 XrtN system VIT domain protein [Taibaiella chishuiensis]